MTQPEISITAEVTARPWCYASKNVDGSYDFFTDDTCRYPGISGYVAFQKTAIQSRYSKKPQGTWMAWCGCWGMGGATPQEATRNLIAWLALNGKVQAA